MYAPTSNSNFDSLFFDDDERRSLYIANNMLTPNYLPTDAPNPSPNIADHNYTHLFNSHNNFLHYSPPPTYYDDFSLTHFLAQYQHQDDQQENDHHQQVQPPPPPPAAEVEENVDVREGKKAAVAPPRPPRRRGVGKTDRHSKIHTAQGARDRRMRLSLPVARRFFDLQDTLGFDKASKTIEWLFHKSKSAIKDALNINIPDDGDELLMISQHKKRSTRISKKEGSKGRSSSNSSGGCVVINDPMVVRESRDKARARARERTREKMMMMANGQNDHHNYNYNLLGNPSNDSSSSTSSSFSSIIVDYPLVHETHIHQNPRAPSIPRDLQVQSAWEVWK